MKDLQHYIESLSEAVAKLGFISNSCPCHDAGLKLLLEDINNDLLQVHQFLDYHTDEGLLQLKGGEES